MERQKAVDIDYKGISVREVFRADLLIDGRLIIEVKAVDRIALVHSRQVLTYLRLLDLPLGVVMNFGGGTFNAGLKRVVNNHRPARTRPAVPIAASCSWHDGPAP